jgi:hypothetical protein
MKARTFLGLLPFFVATGSGSRQLLYQFTRLLERCPLAYRCIHSNMLGCFRHHWPSSPHCYPVIGSHLDRPNPSVKGTSCARAQSAPYVER